MLSASLTPVNSHYELVKLVKNLLDSGLPPTYLDFSDRLLASETQIFLFTKDEWAKDRLEHSLLDSNTNVLHRLGN